MRVEKKRGLFKPETVSINFILTLLGYIGGIQKDGVETIS
jgi:uncharacterized membrane protein YqaE (UPF0057 family)